VRVPLAGKSLLGFFILSLKGRGEYVGNTYWRRK